MTSYPTGFNLELDYPTTGQFDAEVTDMSARLLGALGRTPKEALALGSPNTAAGLEITSGMRMTALYRGGEFWSASVLVFLEHVAPAEAVRVNQQLHAFVRSELQRGGLEKAGLSRIDSEATCLPSVPLLRARHLFATPTPLHEYYTDPAAYHACPNLQVEKLGAHLLTTRALDAIAERDFFAIAQEQAWHLARAAKPGVVTYGGPPKAELLDVYQAPPSRLEVVGYDPDKALAEYACYVEADEHIAGWEIDALHRMLREGKISDGRPLREVRVAFAERAQAEREKRPLLDGGVKVIYSQYGSDHTVSE